MVQVGRFRLQLDDPPAQVREARFQLLPGNQAFGIGVDQPVDCPAEFADLTLGPVQVELARIGLHGGQAPLILRENTRRVPQQPTDLLPHRGIEEVIPWPLNLDL